MHDRRLLVTLDLGRSGRRLEAAEQRVVAALGVEVVGDHEERAGRGRGTRPPAACGWCRRPRWSGRSGPGCRRAAVPAPADDRGRRWSRSPPGRSTKREAPVGAEQEPHADVAAGLAAVLVVHRVDLAVVVRRARRRPMAPISVVEGERRRRRCRRRSGRCCPGSPRAPRCPATAGC